METEKTSELLEAERAFAGLPAARHAYAVGATVRWRPGGRGGLTEQTGTILAIIPCGRSAYAYLPEGFLVSQLRGSPANHFEDRYLIQVAAPGARTLYYTPLCGAVDGRAARRLADDPPRVEPVRRARAVAP